MYGNNDFQFSEKTAKKGKYVILSQIDDLFLRGEKKYSDDMIRDASTIIIDLGTRWIYTLSVD